VLETGETSLEKLAVYSQKAARSGCTGLSGGAPDSVRCARLARANWLLSGLRRRYTAIIHQTVRLCTGLSGEPTVGPANGRPRNPRATCGRANGQKGAPDCPVCTGQCPVVHRTVRCARRQKARIAFLECSQWLLATLGL
jgi:hypothetical protein